MIPILEIDEYKLFKELFERFRQNDNFGLSRILESLIPEDFKSLKEILSTVYIKNEKNLQIPRRIIKIKHR